MSNKSNLETLTHSLVFQIKELAGEFATKNATLSDEYRKEVITKAMIEALLCTVSDTNGAILGASKQHWIAVGQRNDSQSTASVLGQVVDKLMYEDVSKTQEPSINEQASQEILKGIDSDIVH